MTVNATLFAQMIAFTCFVLFTMKFVWPPLAAAMEERKKTIAEGLAAAEQGEKAQEEAKAEAEKLIAEAKAQAAEIVAQAQKRGNDIVEDAKTTAVAEGERLKDAANADIEAEKNKAKQELRGQVVSIAIAGAEKVLEREINADAHKDVLDKFVAQL